MRRTRNTRTVPKATLRGDTPTSLRISTVDDTPPIRKRKKPERVVPQSELLCEEYTHNLQQQDYILTTEINFLQDRLGLDQNGGNMSVDASIRRLRKACSIHEEETKKRKANLEEQIQEMNNRCAQIDIQDSLDKLNGANEREQEGEDDLEAAFNDVYSEVHRLHTNCDVYASISKKINRDASNIQEAVSRQSEALKEETGKLHALEDELKKGKAKIQEQFERLGIETQKALMADELREVTELILMSPQRPPANPAIHTIEAKTAKIEAEVKHMLNTRSQAEGKVDELLEESIRLRAALNDLNSDLETAKSLKVVMDKKFAKRFSQLNQEVNELTGTVEDMRSQNRKWKSELLELRDECADSIKEINQLQSESQILETLTDFRRNEITRIEGENMEIRRNLNDTRASIQSMKQELDEIAQQIADSCEKLKRLEVVHEINQADPRCISSPDQPELGQLLESLNAVQKAIG